MIGWKIEDRYHGWASGGHQISGWHGICWS